MFALDLTRSSKTTKVSSLCYSALSLWDWSQSFWGLMKPLKYWDEWFALFLCDCRLYTPEVSAASITILYWFWLSIMVSTMISRLSCFCFWSSSLLLILLCTFLIRLASALLLNSLKDPPMACSLQLLPIYDEDWPSLDDTIRTLFLPLNEEATSIVFPAPSFCFFSKEKGRLWRPLVGVFFAAVLLLMPAPLKFLEAPPPASWDYKC